MKTTRKTNNIIITAVCVAGLATMAGMFGCGADPKPETAPEPPAQEPEATPGTGSQAPAPNADADAVPDAATLRQGAH